MKKFFNKFSEMISANFEPIFHQEFRSSFKTQYTQYNDVYLLSFGFLKLIDSALKYSKENIINTYCSHKTENNLEELLYKNAIYTDGDSLGFYNYSKYDLEKLSEDKTNIYENFTEYIESFDENTKKVFESYEFKTMIEFLSANDLLFNLISNLTSLDLKNYKFKNHENLKKSYESFLTEFYIWDESRKQLPAGVNAQNFVPEFLVKLLLTDVNFKKKKQISIYDPFCRDGFLLFESKRLIEEINPNCTVNLYGKENNMTLYAICLSKFIIDKENPNNLLKTYDLKSHFIEVKENLHFDFIISNFGIKDLALSYENRFDLMSSNPLDSIFYKLNKNGKMVMSLSSSLLVNNNSLITQILYEDYLESIMAIGLSRIESDLKIIVLNKNKSKKRKNKFLLIDSDEIMREIKDVHCVDMTKPLLDKFYHYYIKFKDSANTHLIQNSLIKDEHYSNLLQACNTGALIEMDGNIADLTFIDTPEKLMNLFNELDQYYCDNCKIQFNFNRFIRGEKDEFDKNGNPIYYLGEIVDLVNDPNPQIQPLDEIFLIPLFKKEQSTESPFFYQSELGPFNIHNMIPFTLTTDKIMKEYLMYYLNSNQGKLELKECTKGCDYLERPDLRFIRVPVPSINEQKEVINAVEKSKEFFDSVDLLKNNFQNNILNYEHILEDIQDFYGEVEFSQEEYKFTKMDRNWRHVFEGLPWPLAITYLSATRGGFETVQKANAYLKLFEFVTLFNAITLISGIPEEYYNEIKDTFLWTKPDNFYSFMTFGKWLKLYEFLKIIYLNDEFNPLIDREFFHQLYNEKILNALKIAGDARNEDAHGPITNEYEAEEVINYLEPLLYDTFDNLTSYSNFKLYYIIGKYERTENGSLKQDVIMLNGPCAQPIYRDFIYDNELDAHSLYFYNPLTDDLLKINDKFMKFRQTDRIKNQWALFIYSGWEHGENGKQAIYRCYQQTEKDYKIKINSFKEDIIG